jgi:AcrR family transcriptional regulator
MTDVKRRPYRSATRLAQAAATRTRIVEAARRLFARDGFGPTTIEAIAREAEVAVPTVYAAFRSKPGILIALLNLLDEEAGMGELIGALRASRSAREQVGLIAHFNRLLFERGQDVIGLALGSVASDPEVAAWAEEGDRRRREGQAPLVDGWARQGALRRGVDEERAADVVWVLTSPEVYRLVVTRLGWTPDAYEEWLTATIERELLAS